MASMKSVKIAEAKNTLSRLLKCVQRGERVRIYDRDRPVADLVPIEPAADDEDDRALLEELVRRGAVRPASNPGPLPPDFFKPPIKIKGESIVETIRKERQEREDAVLGLIGRRVPRRRRTR